MTGTLVIIPCKYSDDKMIYDCVDSVRKFVAADILVVDSCSMDKSYATDINAEVAFIDNLNYDLGAYLSAYRLHPNYDSYICIHDSFMFRSPFTVKPRGFTPFRTFQTFSGVGGGKIITGRKNALKFIFSKRTERKKFDCFGFDNQGQLDFYKKVLEKTEIDKKHFWTAVFGPIFTADRESMSLINACLSVELLPKNKNEQMAYERILGLLSESRLNCNQPYWGDHFLCPLSDARFEKKILNRK